MSKDFPFFRFTVQEWQNGDITLEPFQIQGIFINVCCFYWLSDCSITKAKLKQRLPGVEPAVDLLIEKDIIKWDENTDFIEIDFLNEQYEMLSDLRDKRQKAGKKGGNQKSSKAKAKLKQTVKQSSSYKDNNKDKDNKGSGGRSASASQPSAAPSDDKPGSPEDKRRLACEAFEIIDGKKKNRKKEGTTDQGMPPAPLEKED